MIVGVEGEAGLVRASMSSPCEKQRKSEEGPLYDIMTFFAVICFTFSFCYLSSLPSLLGRCLHLYFLSSFLRVSELRYVARFLPLLSERASPNSLFAKRHDTKRARTKTTTTGGQKANLSSLRFLAGSWEIRQKGKRALEGGCHSFDFPIAALRIGTLGGVTACLISFSLLFLRTAKPGGNGFVVFSSSEDVAFFMITRLPFQMSSYSSGSLCVFCISERFTTFTNSFAYSLRLHETRFAAFTGMRAE